MEPHRVRSHCPQQSQGRISLTRTEPDCRQGASGPAAPLLSRVGLIVPDPLARDNRQGPLVAGVGCRAPG